MKLTREDLAMMLDEMNNNHTDYIDVDVYIYGDYEFDFIDFAIYNGAKFIKSVLTLKP